MMHGNPNTKLCLFKYEAQHPKSMSYGEELKKKFEYTYQTADTKNCCGSFGFCYGPDTVFYDGYIFNSYFFHWYGCIFLTIPRNFFIITFSITTRLKLFSCWYGLNVRSRNFVSVRYREFGIIETYGYLKFTLSFIQADLP